MRILTFLSFFFLSWSLYLHKLQNQSPPVPWKQSDSSHPLLHVKNGEWRIYSKNFEILKLLGNEAFISQHTQEMIFKKVHVFSPRGVLEADGLQWLFDRPLSILTAQGRIKFSTSRGQWQGNQIKYQRGPDSSAGESVEFWDGGFWKSQQGFWRSERGFWSSQEGWKLSGEVEGRWEEPPW